MLSKKAHKNKPSFLERLIGITVDESRQFVVKEHHIVPHVLISPLEKSFKLHDGRELRTIQELLRELDHMSEDEWREYANFGNNHFANWIEDVFVERDLAMKLRQAQDKETMQGTLREYVRSLNT